MLLQACTFRETKAGPEKSGVAKVKAFGLCDIDWVVDENGVKAKRVWDYRLVEGPMKYINTEYVS
jgi:hypothetical protein